MPQIRKKAVKKKEWESYIYISSKWNGGNPQMPQSSINIYMVQNVFYCFFIHRAKIPFHQFCD